jgi:integrase
MPEYKEQRFKLMTPQQFQEGLFKIQDNTLHARAYLILLYYTGARCSELLTLEGKDLTVSDKFYVRITRSKGSRQTRYPLEIRTTIPQGNYLVLLKQQTQDDERFFTFSRTTAYRLCYKAFNVYPHFFRMNRITQLFNQGFSIAQVQNFTGLSLNAIDHYIGSADISQIGDRIT